jgi:hypothetical protein
VRGPSRLFAAQASQQWVELGSHTGIARLSHVVVSPDWPTDPLVVAIGIGPSGVPTGLLSFDGGRRWDVLPVPLSGLRWLQVGSRHVLLGLTCDDQGETCSVVRSSDAGQTWQTVLGPTDLPISVASQWARDGHTFLVIDGSLYRSQDNGQSWALISVAPGRRIHQVVISPAFERDRTVFLTATAGLFDDRTNAGERQRFESALAGDADVLVSKDAGDTWSSSSIGLEHDGLSYRHVQELMVSPAFERDGTLFAFAWGGGTPGGVERTSTTGVRTLLFRSLDRGASWQLVWEPASDPSLNADVHARGVWPRYKAALTLSSRADSNGTGILVLNWWHGGRTNVCRVFRTTDLGQHWDSVLPAQGEGGERLEACGRAAMGGATGLTVLWPVTYDRFDHVTTGWIRSVDGGYSVEALAPPGVTPAGSRSQRIPATLTSDGTVVVGTASVWALRPTVP